MLRLRDREYTIEGISEMLLLQFQGQLCGVIASELLLLRLMVTDWEVS